MNVAGKNSSSTSSANANFFSSFLMNFAKLLSSACFGFYSGFLLLLGISLNMNATAMNYMFEQQLLLPMWVIVGTFNNLIHWTCIACSGCCVHEVFRVEFSGGNRIQGGPDIGLA
uniref:Uncharacterized protein n=1 Tax=Cacopsylla melanoneura TaxID=428564 RepID=A0A8D8Z9T8_9HEMI